VIVTLGAQSDRIVRVASLKTIKGRRRQERYAFEGATLLQEAIRAGVEIDELYATQAALDGDETAAGLGSRIQVYVVSERSFAKLSDVETPSGLLALAPIRVTPLSELLDGDGTVVVLAGLNDPGNAGTLLRSAEAFGARGAVFGAAGVDPFSPKVVRGAMGAFFRLGVAVADPQAFASAAAAAGYRSVGLEAHGTPLRETVWGRRTAVVVGHERRGLGEWKGVCSEVAGIQIAASAESLNAAVAGSIGLYEAARDPRESPS
jgi:TrmH family RNA methyltransferase